MFVIKLLVARQLLQDVHTCTCTSCIPQCLLVCMMFCVSVDCSLDSWLHSLPSPRLTALTADTVSLCKRVRVYSFSFGHGCHILSKTLVPNLDNQLIDHLEV